MRRIRRVNWSWPTSATDRFQSKHQKGPPSRAALSLSAGGVDLKDFEQACGAR
jgi:hypothetical protein